MTQILTSICAAILQWVAIGMMLATTAILAVGDVEAASRLFIASVIIGAVSVVLTGSPAVQR